jgi:hypothetical protein
MIMSEEMNETVNRMREGNEIINEYDQLPPN